MTAVSEIQSGSETFEEKNGKPGDSIRVAELFFGRVSAAANGFTANGFRSTVGDQRNALGCTFAHSESEASVWHDLGDAGLDRKSTRLNSSH